MEVRLIQLHLYIGTDFRKDDLMKTPVQLATMTIDLSNVLEIRDDHPDEITLVTGPPDAADLLVIKGADAHVLRKWLQADHERFLLNQSKRHGVDMRSILSQEPPPTVEEPPF